ncbi:GNAT family N-acetyltransferase [Thalassolituus sp. LLYu03]|uniref:GNAT family N-acetyltransferase n=1 Tax=Thalassolituus sp. LLYu03 TaxID=3421656 RepID=UPI003D2AB449
MKFTPELSFDGGCVRPLTYEDAEAMLALYQQPELPGQRVPDDIEHMSRMVDYSVQMAATQRGMMWLLEADGAVLGMVSAFDWQPSQLRVMMRVDALPQLTAPLRGAALKACMDFLAQKYHVRNFGYQWIAGQRDDIKTMLSTLGFQHFATLRDGWRTGDNGFANVEQFHLLREEARPVAGRLGEQDNPGQNLDKSFSKGDAQ